MSSSESLINMAVVDGLLEIERRGLIGFFAKQFALFSANADGYMLAIAQAIKTNNAADLITQAHKFNGSASCLGAAEISRICIELEKFGQDHKMKECDQLLAELESCYPETMARLAKIAANSANGIV
jgi:HPt (histidine-containing phosphotransfer) domain-containing protein